MIVLQVKGGLFFMLLPTYENLSLELATERRFFPAHKLTKQEQELPLSEQLNKLKKPDFSYHKGKWTKEDTWLDLETAQKNFSGQFLNIILKNLTVVDFDHVLDEQGDFKSDKAKAWYDLLTRTACFCELSLSKHGLHIFMRPTQALNNQFSIVIDDNIKIEVFSYNDEKIGKKLNITGWCYKCESKAPIIVGADADLYLGLLHSDYIKQTEKQKALEKAERKQKKEQRAKFAEIERALTYINYDISSDLETIDIIDALKSVGAPQDIYRQWSGGKNIELWEEGKADLEKPYIDSEKVIFDIAKEHGYEPKIQWKLWIEEGNKEYPNAKAITNIEVLLKWLKWDVKFNDVTKRQDIFIHGEKQKGLIEDYSLELLEKATQNGLKTNEDFILKSLATLARRNHYSPVCDFLNDCCENYDSKDYFEDFFKIFEFKDNQDPILAKTLMWKWLLTACVMAFNIDGKDAADGILILQGNQGIGKTRLLSRLVPNREWFAKGLTLNPRDKDDYIRNFQIWIGELGEFGDNMRRDTIDGLKRYATASEDRLRLPYAREFSIVPRMTAFIGTANDEKFLKDDTGNRRYWVIGLKSIDNDANINIKGLWGQVMQAYKNGESHYLEVDLRAKLNDSNSKFESISGEEDILLDRLELNASIENYKKLTLTELCDNLGLPIDRGNTTKLGKALRHMAERFPAIEPPLNNRIREWLIPPFKKH